MREEVGCDRSCDATETAPASRSEVGWLVVSVERHIVIMAKRKPTATTYASHAPASPRVFSSFYASFNIDTSIHQSRATRLRRESQLPTNLVMIR
jgi:hypothetical protein